MLLGSQKRVLAPLELELQVPGSGPLQGQQVPLTTGHFSSPWVAIAFELSSDQ